MHTSQQGKRLQKGQQRSEEGGCVFFPFRTGGTLVPGGPGGRGPTAGPGQEKRLHPWLEPHTGKEVVKARLLVRDGTHAVTPSFSPRPVSLPFRRLVKMQGLPGLPVLLFHIKFSTFIKLH